jgi:hypothetical protein
VDDPFRNANSECRKIREDALTPTEDEITEIVAILAETPGCFAAVAGQLGDNRLHSRPGKKTWSLNDNLAHIRACADVWGETIEQMLVQDEPDLPHVHPRQYMRQQEYHRLEYGPSFSAFRDQRLILLTRLRALASEDWDRGAMIKTKVRNRRHTVFSQARRMALHEQGHCRQIQALVGALDELA